MSTKQKRTLDLIKTGELYRILRKHYIDAGVINYIINSVELRSTQKKSRKI